MPSIHDSLVTSTAIALIAKATTCPSTHCNETRLSMQCLQPLPGGAPVSHACSYYLVVPLSLLPNRWYQERSWEQALSTCSHGQSSGSSAAALHGVHQALAQMAEAASTLLQQQWMMALLHGLVSAGVLEDHQTY